MKVRSKTGAGSPGRSADPTANRRQVETGRRCAFIVMAGAGRPSTPCGADISAEGVDGGPAASMTIEQRPCVSTCLRFAVARYGYVLVAPIIAPNHRPAHRF